MTSQEKNDPVSDNLGNTEPPPPETSLFRKEVLQNRLGRSLGKVVVISPLSFSVWAVGIFIIATALILFLSFGEYTRRQEVHGMLVPDKGLLYIHAEKPGVIIDKLVNQGDEVKKGKLLYVVSTEQHNLTAQSFNIQQKELLKTQITIQKKRLDTLKKNVERYKHLFNLTHISEIEYQKHLDAFLSAQVALHDLEHRLNQIEGSIDYGIRAPEEGVISVLIGNVGDRITQRHDMLGSLIPKGAKLQGVLYVPSDAIGFIKVGQKVLLKYQAFPYQQFGLYASTIENIDKSTLSPQDIKTVTNVNGPFYRVTVSIEQQELSVNGRMVPLVSGMQFDAIILIETRKLWQWILLPLYSLKGNLAS